MSRVFQPCTGDNYYKNVTGFECSLALQVEPTLLQTQKKQVFARQGHLSLYHTDIKL